DEIVSILTRMGRSPVGVGQGQERRRQRRIAGDGPGVVRDGPVIISLAEVTVAPVGAGGRVAGVEPDRLRAVCDGPVVVSQELVDIRANAVVLGVGWLEADCLGVVSESLIVSLP